MGWERGSGIGWWKVEVEVCDKIVGIALCELAAMGLLVAAGS